ncbi:unnamed protein product [Sphagnum balticum]
MPILRENNKKLEQQLKDQQRQTQELKAALEASQASIEELKNFNSQVAQDRAKEARDDLKSRLVAAKDAGDHEAEVELTEQLQEQTAALAAAKVAPKVDVKPEAKLTPELQAAKREYESWLSDNPWYNSDDEKTGLANGIAAKMRKEGSSLTGRAFFDEVAKRTEARLNAAAGKPTPSEDKVGGGGRSSSSGAGGGAAKGYADLPKEAKEACERYMKNGTIKIGSGAFKTAEEFRKHYATTYFSRE